MIIDVTIGDYGDTFCAHLPARIDVGKAIANVANAEVELCLAGVWMGREFNQQILVIGIAADAFANEGELTD